MKTNSFIKLMSVNLLDWTVVKAVTTMEKINKGIRGFKCLKDAARKILIPASIRVNQAKTPNSPEKLYKTGFKCLMITKRDSACTACLTPNSVHKQSPKLTMVIAKALNFRVASNMQNATSNLIEISDGD